MAARDRLEAPRIDPLVLGHLVEGLFGDLGPHENCDGMQFAGTDVTERDLTGAVFTQCELTGWSADDAVLRSSRLIETRVDRLTATALAAPYLTARDLELTGSRVGAAEWYESEIADAVVSGSKFGWLNLRASTLRDVVFRGCRFDDLDLGGADLIRVAFEDCDTTRLNLQGATAEHLDLRGLRMTEIDGIDGLRGATISTVQAPAMLDLVLSHLGVRVE